MMPELAEEIVFEIYCKNMKDKTWACINDKTKRFIDRGNKGNYKHKVIGFFIKLICLGNSYSI